MRINNLMGMTAYRNTVLNSNALSESIAKLSSGLRINSAKDDAAGLAISQKMKGQIRGLDQANRNINDGINLATTAGGGATEIEEIVQRMRELTVQAANDTNTDEDRAAIALEIDALSKEIDSTAENVEFNTIKIINCADPKVITSNSSSTVSDILTAPSDTSTTTTSYVKLQPSILPQRPLPQQRKQKQPQPSPMKNQSRFQANTTSGRIVIPLNRKRLLRKQLSKKTRIQRSVILATSLTVQCPILQRLFLPRVYPNLPPIRLVEPRSRCIVP